MTDLPHPALLPAGFADALPPEAAQEAAVMERLMALLAANGYERVKPPLVEFEATLLDGVGAAMAGQTFRLMDPVSQRMMGVRADMTLQIARIAGSRLARQARPLRLSYAGQVLRVTGTQLRPERQFAQVGAELIGADEAAADAEIAVLAAGALQALGVARLSLDLTVPTLVPVLLAALAVPERQAAALRHALDRKAIAEVNAAGGPAAAVLARLAALSGPAEAALAGVAELALPDAAGAEIARLRAVARLVAAALPGLAVTIDFVEHRGFEYQTGVSFTLFALDVRGELGRGGRYRTAGVGGDEPATGFTLYMDTVLRAVPVAEPPRRLYLPHGTDRAETERLQAAGWVTVAGLAPLADPASEARRLGCRHCWIDGEARAVG